MHPTLPALRLLIGLLAMLALLAGGCRDGNPAPRGESPAPPAGTSGKPRIRVATEAAYPPMEFVDDKTGEIIGYDIDLMRAVAEAAGYEVEFVNAEWEAIFGLLETRQVQAIISSVTITEERRKRLAFTDPYYRSSQRLVIRAADREKYPDLESLAGKPVGVQTGTTGAEFLKEQWPAIQMRSYSNVILGLQDLVNRRVEAFVVDDPVARFYVAKRPDMALALAETAYTAEEYGIVVHPSDTTLRERLNEGLRQVKEGDVARRLEEKWFR